MSDSKESLTQGVACPTANNRNSSNFVVRHYTPYEKVILLSDGISCHVVLCRVVPDGKKSYFCVNRPEIRVGKTTTLTSSDSGANSISPF
jgi:hypothetical protein